MGHLYKQQQEEASKYVFECLKGKDYLDFNYFFDGTEETHKKVNEALGYGDNLNDETPQAIIDITITELKFKGIISIEEIQDKLPDDENNFRIRFTNKGKRVLNNEKKLEFQDLDL